MTTYPLPALAAQVSENGISAPSFDDTLLSLQATYQGIYGTDVVLTPDTQDGQWLAALAQIVTDVNAAAIGVYNSFSPLTAQGVGLSSVVKINGLGREVSSNSTCPLLITGTAGTIILNGQVSDEAGNVWNLPASVTIPVGNSITVTATAAVLGAIAAASGTITKIRTPTLGWISVTNVSAAAPGAPVESDAKLRKRQSASTSLSAISPFNSMLAAIGNIPGVSRVVGHENVTATTDTAGVPGHTVWIVAEGGDAATIAQTIAASKTPGTGTYGSVVETVVDAYGVPSTVKFDTPTYERILVNFSIKALSGYTVHIGNSISAAIQAYINGLEIGESVYLTQVIAAAIQGSGAPTTFNLVSLTMSISPGTPAVADIAMAFNQAPTSAAADITMTLL